MNLNASTLTIIKDVFAIIGLVFMVLNTRDKLIARKKAKQLAKEAQELMKLELEETELFKDIDKTMKEASEYILSLQKPSFDKPMPQSEPEKNANSI